MRRWQHPDRPMRPYRPRGGTIRTIWHATDGYDTRVTRLRAWSGITGWRFESSSAHVAKAPRGGAFSLVGVAGRRRGELLAATPLGKWGTDSFPVVPQDAEDPMSVHYEASRNRYVVRWREGGRNRSRRFPTLEAADAFSRRMDASVYCPRSATFRSLGWTRIAIAAGSERWPKASRRAISAKTVNNARTCLSVALNEAARRGLIARNPCSAVPALPVDRHDSTTCASTRSTPTSTRA